MFTILELTKSHVLPLSVVKLPLKIKHFLVMARITNEVIMELRIWRPFILPISTSSKDSTSSNFFGRIRHMQYINMSTHPSQTFTCIAAKAMNTAAVKLKIKLLSATEAKFRKRMSFSQIRLFHQFIYKLLTLRSSLFCRLDMQLIKWWTRKANRHSGYPPFVFFNTFRHIEVASQCWKPLTLQLTAVHNELHSIKMLQ